MANTLIAAWSSATAVDRVTALAAAAPMVPPAPPVMADPAAENSAVEDGAEPRVVERREIDRAEALYHGGLRAYEGFDCKQPIRLWAYPYPRHARRRGLLLAEPASGILRACAGTVHVDRS